MKIRSQISTGQFEYSRIEVDGDVYRGPEHAALMAKEVDDAHRAAFAAKPESTLADKEFSELIYATVHHTLNQDIEKYEQMNPAQRQFIKLLTNALNRKKPV